VIGKDTRDAKAIISAHAGASKVAATALLTAIEMLEDHPLLNVDREVRLPLLTPFNSSAPQEIEQEVERRLDDGFRTFKIKVGKDVAGDLARVHAIQRAIDGRGTMRVDANRAFSEADACSFASSLNPSGIELFEQPCRAEDWDANANVAKVSTVPIMLDEPICELADVERASAIANVGFCKLKLKRFGGLDLGGHEVEELLAQLLGAGVEGEVHLTAPVQLSRTACRPAATIRSNPSPIRSKPSPTVWPWR